MNKNSVLIAFSDIRSVGVALLLKRQGMNCVNCYISFDYAAEKDDISFLRSFSEDELKIPFIVVDASFAFRDRLVDHMIKCQSFAYALNYPLHYTELLFQLAEEQANQLSIYYIATGHYVRMFLGGDNLYHIGPPADHDQNQSYLLSILPYSLLERLLFPLGDIQFAKIADLTSDFQFSFIPQMIDIKHFLKKIDIPPSLIRKGNVFLEDGTHLSHHPGLHLFQVGMDNWADILDIHVDKKWKVIAIDHNSNKVWVGENYPEYFALLVYAPSFRSSVDISIPFKANLVFHLAGTAYPVIIYPKSGHLFFIKFVQSYIGPLEKNQIVAIYQDSSSKFNLLLGSATILSSVTNNQFITPTQEFLQQECHF